MAMRKIFLLLFFVFTSAFGQDVALQGVCTSNISTNIKGINGIEKGKEIAKPVYYATIVNHNELTLVGSDEVKKVYRGNGNKGKLEPQNEWSFSDGFTDITLLAVKFDMPVLMYVQSKASPPYFWGPCSISESSLSSYVGTIYAEPSIQKNQGKLISCGIEFSSFIKDFAYYQGQRYMVTGSFGVREGGQNGLLVGYLKVITSRVNSLGKFDGNPEKPNFIYLKSASGKINAKSIINQFDSDAPGGLFAVFNLDKPTMDILFGAISSNKITVVFNREKNGLDVEVPIDLTVESINGNGSPKKSQKAINAYKSCIDDLIKSFK
jgi:hypothetical protein